MTDHDELLELIHAEIDDRLDAPARARLHRTLLQDPAVRRIRDDLRRTCAALDALEIVEPPVELHSRIMESLPAPPPACPDRDVPFSRRSGQRAWRYAAALAGGLFVSLLAVQLATHGTKFDAGELTGTIAAADPWRLEVRLGHVRGTIAVEGATDAPAVQARLVAQVPVAVIARLDGEELRLGNFALDGQPTVRQAAFGRHAASSGVVEISVVDERTGTVLQAARLRLEATD